MDFLCLSAYWRSLKGSSLSHWGIQSSLRLTYWKSRPHWGYHVPHVRDATQEGVSFTAGTRCPRIRFIRPNSVPRLVRPRFIVPSSPYQPYTDFDTLGGYQIIHYCGVINPVKAFFNIELDNSFIYSFCA